VDKWYIFDESGGKYPMTDYVESTPLKKGKKPGTAERV
jgi:hypothetical protein